MDAFSRPESPDFPEDQPRVLAQAPGQPSISVVIPVFNEELVVLACHERLSRVMQGIGAPYELLFVNDGSQDRTLARLAELVKRDACVRVIDFVRNFGHQPAITAGMNEARGQVIVVIDADLQDPPELIADMLAQWSLGFDVVYAQRRSRQGESLFKRASAAVFYRFLDSMSEVRLPLDVGDFRLIDRRVCDALKSLGEHNRYVRGLIAWLGFRQTFVPFDRQARLAGKTKYPLSKMVKFAVDGTTAFSRKPLQLASFLGFLCSFGGFVALLWVLYVKLFARQAIDGWSSMLGIILIGFGMVFFVLGIMGEYLGRLYEEVKGRPHYLIRRIIERKDQGGE